MLKIKAGCFSEFDMIANKSAMTKALRNPVGYINLGEKVYTIINVEIDYADNDFYQEVDIPEKYITKIAVIRETPENLKSSYWFDQNDIYAGPFDGHYDYVIPASSRFINKRKEKAKDKVLFTLDDMGRYPEVCEIVRHDDGKISLMFCNKYIMNAAISVKARPAMFPVLLFRQELYTGIKYFDDDGESYAVIRFANESGETDYYRIDYAHTESEFLRYEIILVPIEPEDAEYLHIGVKHNPELAKFI